MRTSKLQQALLLTVGLAASVSWAQTIDKMKLTDNSLTCAQIYGESLQMDAVIRGGAAPAVANAANPYGINTQAIAAQAQAAGQQLAQDPQVMAMAQQYAAKAQAGALTPQEQQQYAMMMLQNPAVQQQMQGLTGNVLGQMQSSGAINQATSQAMAQGMAQAGTAAANSNPNPLQALFGGNAQAAGVGANSDVVFTRNLMLQSNDPKVRAAANDPQAVAQYATLIRNPQLAAAAQRAAAAGVNPGVIQAQLNAATAAQQAAYAANPGAYAGAAAAPTQANALGSLFGALAASKTGTQAGGQQAANIFGSLFSGAQQNQPQAAAAPAAPAMANNVALSGQAQARKEYLTSMFLGKGCKLSDVKR